MTAKLDDFEERIKVIEQFKILADMHRGTVDG